ncbi:putative F-box protein At1g49610 isoform X1 [Lycium ferocissimum]|uniref:putative F-box protein At1g49610 isoform X1 n=1 Tax=Lycium ferocissimum TaxID=112874 RepID=UPI0028153316|nr:putative F-box protein At1g49610 isoform X1 [Lycium ferocissimum]XP_059302532.1 putative F-box protein At1g49610 isoform X1 [Lycium ferocissimum]
MEMQKKIMLRGDLLSDLPEPILIHILSMLPAGGKEVVRTSVLSTRWRFLWKSVPVSLDFDFPTSDSEKDTLDYLASIHRELYYWRSSHKIRRFRVWRLCYEELYAKHVDLWVHFATTLANVEEFQLGLFRMKGKRYEFPQFAYKNVSLRNLVLWHCQLNPSGSVNWINLVSLSIGKVELTEGVMEKVLSGCPNLECLELDDVSGIRRLEISSVKLRELTIQDYNDELWLEIIAPYIKNLELSGFCCEIRIRQRNVASLVTAMLHLNIENNLEKKISYLKELLHSVAHVEDLKLGTYCIECLSILELKQWQFPPSSRKFLDLSVAFEQLDFPGICSFLQSSLDLETLVIDWYDNRPRDLLSRYINEDEQTRRFETHNFNCSFPHLKTIKIINFYGSVLPLVKYLLKHATMLEKFVIVAAFEESDVSPDYFEMAQELLSFPRSSPHASVIFSY